MASIIGFTNTRFTVNATTVLSMSSWEQGGFVTYAVALIAGGKIQHDTAIEIRGKDRKDVGFRASDYGANLVKDILGDAMPERFFRDNVRGQK